MIMTTMVKVRNLKVVNAAYVISAENFIASIKVTSTGDKI